MQWIKCSERLPKENFWVLCASSRIGCVDHGCLIEGNFYMHGDLDKKMSWVTHWMPLPELPKD